MSTIIKIAGFMHISDRLLFCKDRYSKVNVKNDAKSILPYEYNHYFYLKNKMPNSCLYLNLTAPVLFCLRRKLVEISNRISC